MKPFRLSSLEREFLEKPVKGRGGFQELLRHLQRCAANSDGLHVSLGTFRRMERYAFGHGRPGGFQQRLSLIVQVMAQENGLALTERKQGEMFA